MHTQEINTYKMLIFFSLLHTDLLEIICKDMKKETDLLKKYIYWGNISKMVR